MSSDQITDELARRAAYLERRAEKMPNYERHQEQLAAGLSIREILVGDQWRPLEDTDVEPEYEEGREPHWSGFDTREEYLGLK